MKIDWAQLSYLKFLIFPEYFVSSCVPPPAPKDSLLHWKEWLQLVLTALEEVHLDRGTNEAMMCQWPSSKSSKSSKTVDSSLQLSTSAQVRVSRLRTVQIAALLGRLPARLVQLTHVDERLSYGSEEAQGVGGGARVL